MNNNNKYQHNNDGITSTLVIASKRHGTQFRTVDSDICSELEKYSWKTYPRVRRGKTEYQVAAWIPELGKVVSLQKFIAGEAASKLKVVLKETGTDFRKSNLHVLGRFYDIKPAPRKGKGVVSVKLWSRALGEIKIYLDKKNLAALSKHQWTAMKNPRSPYGRSAIYFCDSKDRSIRLHRMVCELNPEMICFEGGVADHIDGDQLNNIEANLRWVTEQENKWNRAKPKSGKNKYVGVFKSGSRWGARIGSGRGQHRIIGYFDTPEEAAIARDREVARVRTIVNPQSQFNFPENWNGEEYKVEVT